MAALENTEAYKVYPYDLGYSNLVEYICPICRVVRANSYNAFGEYPTIIECKHCYSDMIPIKQRDVIK